MTEQVADTLGQQHQAETHDITDRGLFRMERRPLTDGPADGALVLLVHGSMDRATSFRRVGKHLPDWSIVAFDRRGYAGSVGARPSEDFATQVDDLLEVLGDRQAVGVGHSYGGAVLLAAAAQRPDLLDTVVIYEPPQPWRDWWPRRTAGGQALGGDREPADLAEGFMRRMVGDRVWQGLPAATRQRRREEGEALRAEMRALRDGPCFDATTLKIPVLASSGSEGSVHQKRSARVLADEAPYGYFVEVDGAGHGVHLSHPRELASLARLGIERRHPGH